MDAFIAHLISRCSSTDEKNSSSVCQCNASTHSAMILLAVTNNFTAMKIETRETISNLELHGVLILSFNIQYQSLVVFIVPLITSSIVIAPMTTAEGYSCDVLLQL